jgi:hypothetical protein
LSWSGSFAGICFSRRSNSSRNLAQSSFINLPLPLHLRGRSRVRHASWQSYSTIHLRADKASRRWFHCLANRVCVKLRRVAATVKSIPRPGRVSETRPAAAAIW